MEYQLEVVVPPVSDVDRSAASSADEPGVDPGRRDHARFAGFTDPDGGAWTLQERGFRPA
ncbi:hypothetical protein [Streptomyces mexicanus]|jgi:hypothetical protein|uniref:hypothetical protein n=1 Tax=Streptomyces mexicanus TaxID=178566 RepID=UPI0036AFBEF2